jgi:MHS family proline/betaine transporter-like MFS transporter
MKFYFKLQFISAFLGNLFEHYDLALYSLLTPFFASIFFPEQNQITALIMTFAIIPLGMLARPIGAIVFGYIGDYYGRGQALFISLLGLGIISGLLAFAPTFHQAGWIAPILLLSGRILQNFFGIGENLGGAIYLLEQTDEKHQNLVSSLYGSSTIAGFLLASFGVSVLSYFHLVESGWRYLYMMGFFTAIFGAILRKKIPFETTERIRQLKQNWLKNLLILYWNYRIEIIQIALVSGFSYATYSISLVFFNGFVPLISSVTKDNMMQINTFLLLFDLMALPLFGWLSDKYSRQKMMLISALCTLLTGAPFFAILQAGSWSTIIVVRITIVLLGVWFVAPFHAWAQKLIPIAHRYSVISFGYAIGSQLIGGPTAVISLWIYQKTDVVWAAACYWSFLALATSATLAFQIWFKGQRSHQVQVNNYNYPI